MTFFSVSLLHGEAALESFHCVWGNWKEGEEMEILRAHRRHQNSVWVLTFQAEIVLLCIELIIVPLCSSDSPGEDELEALRFSVQPELQKSVRNQNSTTSGPPDP